MGAERRRHERFALDLPIQVEAADAGAPRKGTCLNVSEGGILVEVDEPLEKGTHVYVEMVIPPLRRAFCADAEVAWSMDALPGHGSRAALGLRFTELSEEYEAVLLEIIRTLKGKG